jgi:hypothetical protein
MHDALFVYEPFRTTRYLKGCAGQARPSVASLSRRSFNATENTADDTAVPELIAKGIISKQLRAAKHKKEVTGDLLRNALTEKERNSFKQIPTS